MNIMSIKRGLMSMGIACIISAPILRAAMMSQNIYHPISFANESTEEIKQTEVLVMAEEERMERIDNPFVIQCEQYILSDSQDILDSYGVVVPEDIREYCEDAEKEFEVCAELLEAIAWRESRFMDSAENGGCSGLMQVSTRWHKGRMQRLGVTDIYDAQGNIRVAADYLRELFETYDGDLYKVLMTYNGDSGKGVSKYALEIAEISEALERVHGK